MVAMKRLCWTAGVMLFCLGIAMPSLGMERRMGARPQGMGDAFMALSDDMNALTYNPAGLSLIKDIEGTLEYANLYPGLDDGMLQENHIAYAHSLGQAGSLAAAWNNRSILGTYHENEFMAGYAAGLDSIPLRLGAALKVFYLGYTDAQSLQQNEYFRDSATKLQAGIDLGMMYEPPKVQENWPLIRYGLSIININEPDLGIKASDRQPIETRIGAALIQGEWDGAVDAFYKDSTFQVHAGAEKWFMNKTWAARVGVMGGDKTATTATLGGSLMFALDEQLQLRVNYAFQYPFSGIQDTAGIHRVAIDFIFPLSPASPQTMTAAPCEQKREKIKKYLFKRIDDYVALSRKLGRIKTSPDSADLPAIQAVDELLQAAEGQLIELKDIAGFLKKTRQAENVMDTLGASGEESGELLLEPEKQSRP